MTEFVNKFFALITVAGVLLLALATLIVMRLSPEVAEQIEPYLQQVDRWLPVLVLLWLWKFGKDWRDDLRIKTENSEELIAQLWNAFSGQIADADLDQGIRGVLVRYPSVVREQQDVRIGEKARENIKAAGSVLENRQYSIDFDAMVVYPKPFYESAKNSILATSIGDPANFWGKRDELLQMNRDAVRQGVSIRRVFAVNKYDDVEVDELIANLEGVGVEIRRIDLTFATNLASEKSRRGSEIEGLTDFTIFDTEVIGLYYSGRFDANYQRIVISSHPQTIEDLTNQFNLLWEAAEALEGQVDADATRPHES